MVLTAASRASISVIGWRVDVPETKSPWMVLCHTLKCKECGTEDYVWALKTIPPSVDMRLR